jgi:pyruvate,orthophosphate dikinase
MPRAVAKPARRLAERRVRRSSTAPKARAKPKWVYRFAEGNATMKALLGGKGANLAEMTSMGLPVPPGFIVTTQACNATLEQKKFPPELWDQVLAALASLEKATGKRFGDPRNPLLVSCRSGAKFSMPGMMDTVLNIGLNDEVVEGLAKLSSDRRFAFDAYRRLVQMFATVVLGVADEPFEEVLAHHRKASNVGNDADLAAEDLAAITAEFKAIVRKHAKRAFPTEPIEQLRLAIEAVFKSWNGKRAIDYRNAANIPHDLGTAVNIQTMVFGNLGDGSATVVVCYRKFTSG